ncbi:TetR family transcriptional regulator [Novosphingobium humi]|uniref:TetR family transcriptional regulator n=1 Tax=Novosphingobium humi TaxID=2282397 RepID=A0ABY7TT64_9SPHN|nr:TetR family transcriptional regulator [Novosphingobium humi]WCT76208.1 TetR family transcriptional regulator [Novosphingobium humi]WJS97330.1 TetR family transcriptional regulator [Novosphingobium humi]
MTQDSTAQSENKGLSKRQLTALRTREDILEVAGHEFSEKGLAGARIDEIAEKTQTSKRMIYYHFGSKDGLYQAVLQRAYETIRNQEQAARFEDLSPEQALRAIIGHNFDYHFEHPDFVRLVMNENVHKGDHIAQIPGMRERNRTVIAALGAILKKGVDQGVFRDGIDPVDLHMTISALSFYNVSNRYTFLQNFGVDFAESAQKARRRVQIIDCVLRWVKAG